MTFCNSAITSINLGQPSSQALIGYRTEISPRFTLWALLSILLQPNKETTDYVFDFFLLSVSSPFWPGTPALLHMHDIPPTPARLPDFPLLANSQTWSAHAGKTFQPQCNPCSPSLSPVLYEWMETSVGLVWAITPSSSPTPYHAIKCCSSNIQGVQAQYATPPTSLNTNPPTTCSLAW